MALFRLRVIRRGLALTITSLSHWKNQACNGNTTNNQPWVNNDKNTFLSLPTGDWFVSNNFPLTLAPGYSISDENTLDGEMILQQWQEALVSFTKALLP